MNKRQRKKAIKKFMLAHAIKTNYIAIEMYKIALAEQRLSDYEEEK